MDVDYYSQYIKLNFDTVLLENNNNLINSQDFYLQYKKNYFEETNMNYQSFQKLNNELKGLLDKESSINGTKYSFVFVDQTRINDLKTQLKNILIKQNKLLDNFNNYIILLNTDQYSFHTPNSTKVKTKNFSLNSLFKKRN
jgi:hypothetical protein